MSDKTEEPTPRRLRRAREEGDAGVSSYAGQALAFLVAVAIAPAVVRAVAEGASADLRAAIAMIGSHTVDVPQVNGFRLGMRVLGWTLPLVAAAAIASGVLQGLQTGGVFASSRLAPTLERLDPFRGIGNLLTRARLFAAARALVAAGAVSAFGYLALRRHIADEARMVGRPRWIAPLVSRIGGEVAGRAALVGLVLGVFDLLVTRTAWRRRLRMSKAEIIREHRDAEGDPQLKAARERAAHEMLAQATIANVRNASVVVVNPTHLACALRYDDAQGDAAPVVVARGEGPVASGILAAARAHAVPVVHDVSLARALVELEPGDAIPQELYEAVAEILRDLAERAS